MATPTLQTTNVGFPAQYASKIENMMCNQQGDNVTVTAAAGDALIAIAIGLRSYPPFDLFHTGYSVGTGTAAGYFRALTDTVAANPTISDNSSDSVAVTSVTQTDTAYAITSVANASGGNTVYTGTFATGLTGYYFTVAGTDNAAENDGYFLCTASSATTLTLANPNGLAETSTGSPTATDYVVSLVTAGNNFSVGDTVKLAGFVTETWLNGQSQAVVVAGSTFTVNDGSKHAGSGPTAQTTATAARTSGNDWALLTNLNVYASDYTPGATPPTAPNPYPSSMWNIDGYYPSVYVWVATGVSAGTYNVNLNSMYVNPASTSDLSAGAQVAGKPIFDGGVNFQVIKFSNIATSSASDGNAIGASTDAAAAPTAFNMSTAGDLLLAVGLMKSGNAFSLGKVNQGGTDTTDAVSSISNGALVGSEAHYAVEYAIPAASSATTKLYFSNPLGYEMIVANIALKSS